MPMALLTPAPFERIGVEQAIAESGIDFFFVDTHLVEESARVASPYERGTTTAEPGVPSPHVGLHSRQRQMTALCITPTSSPAHTPVMDPHTATTTIFPRDPRTGIQVWSGEHGLPR